MVVSHVVYGPGEGGVSLAGDLGVRFFLWCGEMMDGERHDGGVVLQYQRFQSVGLDGGRQGGKDVKK